MCQNNIIRTRACLLIFWSQETFNSNEVSILPVVDNTYTSSTDSQPVISRMRSNKTVTLYPPRNGVK